MTKTDAIAQIVNRLEDLRIGSVNHSDEDDDPCCECGDTYDLDDGKESTGFCHECASNILSELIHSAALATLVAARNDSTPYNREPGIQPTLEQEDARKRAKERGSG